MDAVDREGEEAEAGVAFEEDGGGARLEAISWTIRTNGFWMSNSLAGYGGYTIEDAEVSKAHVWRSWLACQQREADTAGL